MKKLKDLTINDTLYYVILKFPLGLKDIVGRKIKRDKVIDKYDFYHIKLHKLGDMYLQDEDLEKKSDALESDDDVMFISTSENNIAQEIKNYISKKLKTEILKNTIPKN